MSNNELIRLRKKIEDMDSEIERLIIDINNERKFREKQAKRKRKYSVKEKTKRKKENKADDTQKIMKELIEELEKSEHDSSLDIPLKDLVAIKRKKENKVDDSLRNLIEELEKSEQDSSLDIPLKDLVAKKRKNISDHLKSRLKQVNRANTNNTTNITNSTDTTNTTNTTNTTHTPKRMKQTKLPFFGVNRNTITDNSTITITFGDVAENAPTMEKIGTMSKRGFTKEDMDNAERIFTQRGLKCERVNLTNALRSVGEDILKSLGITKKIINDSKIGNASILIVRNAVNNLLDLDNGADLLYKEHKNLKWDKHKLNKGKVMRSIARYNLCYGDECSEPDYANKKGRVVSFDSLNLLNKIRSELPNIIGESASNLNAEGNFYYDITKTAIGWHGDAERRKVIAIRLGKSFPIHYQWYYKSKPVGKRITKILNHGDLYIMSEKAVGTDWKKKNILTLRHAAGSAKKYIDPPK